MCGWDKTATPGAKARILWGCERPEAKASGYLAARQRQEQGQGQGLGQRQQQQQRQGPMRICGWRVWAIGGEAGIGGVLRLVIR